MKGGFIQNLSSTDTLTVSFNANSGSKISAVAVQGATLNPAPASSQGGDTHPFGNVDLGDMSIVFSTNSGQGYAVYYET